MKTYAWIGALLLLASWPASGPAADFIKTHSSKDTLKGSITEITESEVKIDTKPVEISVKANDIISIRFEDEPDGLGKARTRIKEGDYEDGLRALESIDRSMVPRKEVLADIDYLTAYCTTQLALGGVVAVKDAGSLMKSFIEANPKSYHFFEANELFGDLCLAAGRFDVAMRYYEAAAKAPWQEAAVRIDVKRGNALLFQNNPKEAMPLFQQVSTSTIQGPAMERTKDSAQIGTANALAATGRAEEGIKLLELMIKRADRDDAELLGPAWLAMGNCYRAAKKPHDAEWAYLHVDLLFPSSPQVHAETLASLASLWQELNKPDRARDAMNRLVRAYPNSRFAVKKN